MIPIINVTGCNDKLPTIINGKLDQKKLPKPISASLSSSVDEHEDLLTQIRQLFASTLSLPLEVIDNHVTFDEMGGDSIYSHSNER